MTINTTQVFSSKVSSLSFCRTSLPASRLHFLAGWDAWKENATARQHDQSYPWRQRLDAREDQEDVDKVLSGDISAFERIVQRWQGPIVNLAYRFCRDRSRAEDIAQEAFLRAFRGLKGWRRDAAFSTWLFAIATNVYRSELRRIPELPLDSIEGLEALNSKWIESADFTDDDRDRAVRRSVAALPGKYKEVLVLFYFHEMDISATSRSLGLPEGTVKARLSRGRKILRSKLPQFLGELKLKEAQ
jgi:RNA polymerase sigma-70 factor (ECF subfamily)